MTILRTFVATVLVLHAAAEHTWPDCQEATPNSEAAAQIRYRFWMLADFVEDQADASQLIAAFREAERVLNLPISPEERHWEEIDQFIDRAAKRKLAGETLDALMKSDIGAIHNAQKDPAFYSEWRSDLLAAKAVCDEAR